MKYLIAGESDIGLRRENNEDNFIYVNYSSRKAKLAVVADGMGGHDKGEIASLISCLEFAKEFNNTSDSDLSNHEKLRTFLEEIIELINQKIFSRNKNSQLIRPMGCTVVAMVYFENKAVIGSVGDSRIYEYSQTTGFNQLTTDHSINILVDEKNNKYRSVISKAVGVKKDLTPDIIDIEIAPNNRYLLCSDGISSYIPEEKIVDYVKNSETPRKAVDGLIRTALISGGRDNATAVCVFAV